MKEDETMDMPANAVYQADCLSLLERLCSGRVTLAYIDPPWYTDPDLKEDDLKTYLSFLGQVLQQVKRVLSESGCVFFHSSPYFPANIRLILDQVFDRNNFVTEIIWPRRPEPLRSSKPTAEHETIYLYSKTSSFMYNAQMQHLAEEKIRTIFNHTDSDGRRFKLIDLTSPVAQPYRQYEWKGIFPPANRSWRYSREVLNQLAEEGKIYQSEASSIPRLKVYLAESTTNVVGSVWNDIPSTVPQIETVHYGTQKPLALLERIVRMGTNPGDYVVDPFCGAGTALTAAHANGRQWIGCDISSEAVSATMDRLNTTFGQDFLMLEQEFLENNFPVVDHAYTKVVTDLELADLTSSTPRRFVLNQAVAIEETRHYEFKEVKSGYAVRSIKNTADEYVVAFLNSGVDGRIYWGIRDSDRVVTGVELNHKERDELRRDVNSKLQQIQPPIDPAAYSIRCHPIYDKEEIAPDLYVIEIMVPRTFSKDPYFTGGNEAFVKVDGGKKKLNGPELVDWIRRRDRVEE